MAKGKEILFQSLTLLWVSLIYPQDDTIFNYSEHTFESWKISLNPSSLRFINSHITSPALKSNQYVAIPNPIH